MSIPSAVKPQTRPPRVSLDAGEAGADLKFISDLGRSLLFMVHPKKVACRVADAIQHGVGAELCAFVAELENIGVVSCAFDAKGEIVSEFLDKSRSTTYSETGNASSTASVNLRCSSLA